MLCGRTTCPYRRMAGARVQLDASYGNLKYLSPFDREPTVSVTVRDVSSSAFHSTTSLHYSSMDLQAAPT